MKSIIILLLLTWFTCGKSMAGEIHQSRTIYIDTLPLPRDSSDKIYTKVDASAQFPGGDKAWAKYLKKYIENNLNALVDDNQSGTCKVIFIVDKEGNVSNIKTITMRGSKLSEVAEQAITKGPKWVPAIRNGEKVNSYRMQPVTFTISTKER